MNRAEFEKLTQSTLLLDGATGSCLMAAGKPAGVCNETWILENKNVLIDLQKAYIDAGSSIIYAPTFGGNRASLSLHGLENKIEQLNHELVQCSITAANGRTLIAGDITTTGKMIAPGGDLTYDMAFEIYREQIKILYEAGVDLIVAETMISIDETLAAIDACLDISPLPIMCSVSAEADGSLFTGGNAIDACLAFEAAGASAVGLNCSVGPDQLVSIIRNIRESVSVPVIAKPNAGMPYIDDFGKATYSMNAEDFASHVKVLADQGASLIGGCCGTTPEYIKATKKILNL